MDKKDIIYAYTRNQAIADGVLIDVSEMAKEAGFVWPVAVTAAVHAEYVAVPSGVTGQDEAGRLWDILTMLRFAIRRCQSQKDGLLFTLLVNNGKGARKVTLKSLRGYEDDGTPCLTILLPDED